MPPPSVRPADAGRGEETGRGGHAERDGGVIDVSPGAAGVDADGVIFRADRSAAQQRQVDDQRIVGDAQAGRVVAAASDGEFDAVLAAEPHARDDVGRVAAARDSGRMLVDHGVVDGACLVIAGIARQDQITAQNGGQVVVGAVAVLAMWSMGSLVASLASLALMRSTATRRFGARSRGVRSAGRSVETGEPRRREVVLAAAKKGRTAVGRGQLRCGAQPRDGRLSPGRRQRACRMTSGSHHRSYRFLAATTAASSVARAAPGWQPWADRSASSDSQYGIRAKDPADLRLPMPRRARRCPTRPPRPAVQDQRPLPVVGEPVPVAELAQLGHDVPQPWHVAAHLAGDAP